MKKIILGISVSLLGVLQLYGKFCDITKKYDQIMITDTLSDAIDQCLTNYPNDVESCVWCTFDGHIEEYQLKQAINEAVLQKKKAAILSDVAIIQKKKGQKK